MVGYVTIYEVEGWFVGGFVLVVYVGWVDVGN